MNFHPVPNVPYEEGWDVFYTGRSEDHAYELQRDDELQVFDTDEDAWLHVWTQAHVGSAVHSAVLAFLEAESPTEYQWILEHVTTLED
jgi:hypothetical protein